MTDNHEPRRMEDDWDAAQEEMRQSSTEEEQRPDKLTTEAARRLLDEATRQDERLTEAQIFAAKEHLNVLRGLKKLESLGYFSEELQAELEALEERFKDK